MSEAFRALAAAAPEALAVVDDTGSLSRAQADQRVEALAARLRAHGAGPGDRIAWSMPNRAEVVLLALAAQRVGAVVVALSYRSSRAELSRMLAFAQPAVAVVDATTHEAVAGAADSVALLDVDAAEATETGGDPPPSEERTAPPAPAGAATGRLGAGASMLFTSGTTGSPKAALRTSGDAALSTAIADAFGFHSATRYLSSGPLYHSGPWTCALMVLARGGAVVLRPSFDPVGWLAAARRHGVTASFCTPTLLRRLVEAVESGAPAPETLETVVVSGEPFRPELKRRAVAALGHVLLDCYGSTELGPMTAMPPASLLERPTSCGRPFPGVEVAAFEGQERLGPGHVGLLRGRTPLAFAGYLRDGADAPDDSGQGWATVGDLGFVDDDGYVHLIDRSDDMIISGGVNIFPADVEAVLSQHPEIRQCAVVGAPDPEWGQAVCAFVVGDRPLEVAEVRAWLRGRISDDKRPRRVVNVSELPTTGTEKIARAQLRERLADSGARHDEVSSGAGEPASS
ncbi:class I adenylate-forming enzyme family protein [Salinactinospora qingdaonensis]|uniref:Acyl-CoA synthetase n=1 Tax=Salinactinospora qingdaonensis TaxID=702744 RepID=A0ABP7F8X0_9ACTN